MKTITAILTAIFLCMLSTSFAQNIGVTVDSRPVQFGSVGPQTIGGRVLVPLRGVLEQMGAFVGWDPAARRIIAEKSGTDVQLTIGSTVASINGRDVTLDVPPMILSGTTLVPLRFLGEALGADVKWDAPTRTVVIETIGGEDVPPMGAPVQDSVEISLFSHNSSEWLKAGDKLQITMRGTPGAVASFEIPGVLKQTSLPESGSGLYKATWTVPDNAPSISGASMLGLLKLGAKERLIQAGNPINIDVTPPVVRNSSPIPDSSVSQNKPAISAAFDDGSGSGIDLESLKISINGENVTSDAVITQSFFTYRPIDSLPSGINTVTVYMRDVAGNPINHNWKFTIAKTADVIKSFTYSIPNNVGPGDSITARMEAPSGGSASFSLVDSAGRAFRTQNMDESQNGIYTGEYTIRRNDNIAGMVVTGSFTSSSGEKYSTQVEKPIAADVQALRMPTITRPTEGASENSPLTVRGTGNPGGQVMILVKYETKVLGALKMNGVLAEKIIDVDNNGVFTSEPINLSTLGSNKSTDYTLTAVSVGVDGQESDPVVVKFRGK